MTSKKNKIIAVLGPNASGKSELAVKIAKKFNGEIISADSRQVYKYLNIGSGKVEGGWKKFSKFDIKKYFVYKDIIHHCVDFVPIKKIFSAGEFKKCAEEAICDILNRGKVPIICGGTGFYIDAALGNIDLPLAEPDWKLRKELEKKSEEELFLMLKKLNPERAKKIDKNNKRRLVRAVEIESFFSGLSIARKEDEKYKILYLGVKHPPEALKERIEKRLNTRIDAGMIDEVQKLHKSKKISWKRLNDLGLEYRYISYFLRGEIKTIEELREILKIKIRQYAKRQITWFKRNKKINWISLSKEDFEEIVRLVRRFLTE